MIATSNTSMPDLAYIDAGPPRSAPNRNRASNRRNQFLMEEKGDTPTEGATFLVRDMEVDARAHSRPRYGRGVMGSPRPTSSDRRRPQDAVSTATRDSFPKSRVWAPSSKGSTREPLVDITCGRPRRTQDKGPRHADDALCPMTGPAAMLAPVMLG